MIISGQMFTLQKTDIFIETDSMYNYDQNFDKIKNEIRHQMHFRAGPYHPCVNGNQESI